MITTMAIKAMDMNIELKGTKIDIQKHMVSDPRRIGKIDITLIIPAIAALSEKDRTILERVGDHCPVVKSIHPDIELNISYQWI